MRKYGSHMSRAIAEGYKKRHVKKVANRRLKVVWGHAKSETSDEMVRCRVERILKLNQAGRLGIIVDVDLGGDKRGTGSETQLYGSSPLFLFCLTKIELCAKKCINKT